MDLESPVKTFYSIEKTRKKTSIFSKKAAIRLLRYGPQFKPQFGNQNAC